MTDNQMLINDMNSCNWVYIVLLTIAIILVVQNKETITYFLRLTIGGVFGIITCCCESIGNLFKKR